jgi:hypothetical protein
MDRHGGRLEDRMRLRPGCPARGGQAGGQVNRATGLTQPALSIALDHGHQVRWRETKSTNGDVEEEHRNQERDEERPDRSRRIRQAQIVGEAFRWRF